MRHFILLLTCSLGLCFVFAQPLQPPLFFPKLTSDSFEASAQTQKTTPKSGLRFHKKTPVFVADKAVESVDSMDVQSDALSKATTKNTPATVQWLSFEEVLEKQKTEKRKVFLDVYTEWCGWCKRMDETTFLDPAVVKTLNEKYYAVKFDAEQKSDIVFNGKTYKYVGQNGRRGYHELAHQFLNGRLGYPTSVFMDENMNVIQPLPGYLDGDKLNMILTYFGTNSHQTMPWDTYEKQHSKN